MHSSVADEESALAYVISKILSLKHPNVLLILNVNDTLFVITVTVVNVNSRSSVYYL